MPVYPSGAQLIDAAQTTGLAVRVTNGLEALSFDLIATTVDKDLITFPFPVLLISATYRPQVIGSDLSAVTAALTKVSGTTAPASGTALQTGTFDLKGTARTNQAGVLVANQSSLTFAAGDSLSLDVTGTLTAVVGLLTVVYQRL